jgi:hypothetical protein
MDRIIFVVRQDRAELYGLLQKAFAHDQQVEVILERRRLVTRRRAQRPSLPERRQFNRRFRRVEGEVAARGWTVVRIPS